MIPVNKNMTPEEITQAIKEFKIIYKKVMDAEPNDEEATIMALGLLQLIDLATQETAKEVK
jgi:hypothetical protein